MPRARSRGLTGCYLKDIGGTMNGGGDWSGYFWIRSTGFPIEWLDEVALFPEDVVFERWLENMRAGAPDAVEAFRETLEQSRDALRCRMRDPAVREALFLSNPAALERIDRIAAPGPLHIDRRTRERLRLAWSYLQRFCAKNDTISFFGPIAWGRFAGTSAPSIRVARAPGEWIAVRRVFFEHWVVRAVAQAVARDEALADAIPLRMNPGCHLDRHNILHAPIDRRVRLPELGRWVCAQVKQEIGLSTDALVARAAQQGLDSESVHKLVDRLLEKGVLLRELTIPPSADDAGGYLRRALAQISTTSDRAQRWAELVAELERLRGEFERGDLDARMRCAKEMNILLDRAGINTTRTEGQMYVGRFPVYEDCARNLHVDLGGVVQEAIERDLSAILPLYIWLADAVATTVHAYYLQIWRELNAGGDDGVDFLAWLTRVQRADVHRRVAAELTDKVRDAWRWLLRDRGEEEEVLLSRSDLDVLCERLRAAGPTPLAVRPLGVTVHSPDFMIAAPSLTAIDTGQFELIVGEVHPAVHTVSQPVAAPFNARFAADIEAEVSRLLAERTVVLADSSSSYQRSHIDWLDRPELWQVELPGAVARVDASRRIASGAGRVHERAGVLWFRDTSTGIEADLVSVVPGDFHRACFALAGEILGAAEAPRLRFGRVVLKRRAWRLAAEDLPRRPRPAEDAAAFAEWSGWARRRGFPRHVFVKLASQPKPVFVDFRNPFSLEQLASLARDGGAINVTEMRPAPHELWLSDPRGHYCSEFRTSWSAPRGVSRETHRVKDGWVDETDRQSVNETTGEARTL